MFWHNFKNDFKCCFREKSFLFWILAFPIILSVFFHLTFSGIYETDVMFESIPAAIVEVTENKPFKDTVNAVCSQDEPLLKVTFTDESNALDLIESGEIQAIIYVDEKISLKVSPEGESMKQTIIREFVDTYRINEKIITDTAINNPQNLESVIANLSKEINCNEDLKLTDGNMDPYASFFYNLIAMAAFFGSVTGLHIAISNQANLSELAARKAISPTNKMITIISNICASLIAQTICVCIAISFILFVLGENLGDKYPFIYLTGFVGSLTGITMGFFIGSIGKISQGVKTAIAMSVSMGCCFLSGLMIGNMKMMVENAFPLFNRINPAALISDMFYCLNVYDNYKLYSEKLITLLILSVVFTVGGFLLTRRKKYASL